MIVNVYGYTLSIDIKKENIWLPWIFVIRAKVFKYRTRSIINSGLQESAVEDKGNTPPFYKKRQHEVGLPP